jgi:hypothetical protein
MKRLLGLVSLACLIGVVMVLILLVPFVGAFTVGLLLSLVCMLPVAALKPYCGMSEHVTVGFAWITIHTPSAYVVYWAIYSFLAFAWLTVRDIRTRMNGDSSRAIATSADAIHEAVRQHKTGAEVTAECPACLAKISVRAADSSPGLVSLSCRCGACRGKFGYPDSRP